MLETEPETEEGAAEVETGEAPEPETEATMEVKDEVADTAEVPAIEAETEPDEETTPEEASKAPSPETPEAEEELSAEVEEENA